MKTLEECTSATLDLLDTDVRKRFALDPLTTMQTDLGLTVRPAEHLTARADGGACDGLSFLSDGVILYAPTPSSRRQHFTLGHELGHWLVTQVPEVFDWLAAQLAPKHALETLCDQVAQQLLLGDATAAAAIGAGPIRAQHVIDLYNASQASLPVCTIALAKRLPGLGAIIVLKRELVVDEHTVQYASVRADPEEGWPRVYPWPGQRVPAGNPLKVVRGPVQRRTTWAMPWGETAEFYMDAIPIGSQRTLAVLAGTDLWGAERFHPETPRDFDVRPRQDVMCCGQRRSVRGYPCPTCGQIPCPSCGKCRCDRQDAELVRCAGSCFLSYRPSLLADGLCEECR